MSGDESGGITKEAQSRQRDDRYRDALLNLTTNNDVGQGNLEAALATITETAAEVLEVARVNIWLLDDTGTSLQCFDHYDRRTGRHDDGMELDTGRYPTYISALEDNLSVAATDANQDPRTAELSDDYLAPNDIDALLDATLRTEGEFAGVVCHEAVDGPRDWTDAEIEFATAVADVAHRAYRNYVTTQQRDQLRRHKSLLEAQQDAIREGLIVVGEDGTVRSYNQQFADLFDIPAELLDDSDLEGVLDTVKDQMVDPESFQHTLTRLSENPTDSYSGEIDLVDGRVLAGYSTPVITGDDQYQGRLWMVRDITERRERTRELELKNRAIEEAPIGITLTDAEDDQPLTYVNERFVELTGYAESALLGENCRLLQGDETDPEPVARMRRAINQERSATVELRNYRKDGSQFWNRVTIAPVRDDAGTVTHYVGFQEDVTDRREATRQLKVLHRMLRHNMANQLSIIRGTAEEMASGDAGEWADPASQIVEETDRLLEITEKHRQVVQLLSEQPAPQWLSVDTVVKEAVRSVAREWPTASIQVAGTDADVSAVGIPAVQTAIEELLENAVEHADVDRPHVSVSVHERPETVAIRVADEGPGLPEEERRILTGDQAVDPLDHGLGMGLWLVFWIVTLSAGTLSVDDTATSGTVIEMGLSRNDPALKKNP